jgi:hypothetical protein
MQARDDVDFSDNLDILLDFKRVALKMPVAASRR